jgi:hypothetical protein
VSSPVAFRDQPRSEIIPTQICFLPRGGISTGFRDLELRALSPTIFLAEIEPLALPEKREGHDFSRAAKALHE